MPPKTRASHVVDDEPRPPSPATVYKNLCTELLDNLEQQSVGERCAVEIVNDIVDKAGNDFISRHYDALAVNYAVLGCWDLMMGVVETSLVAHDGGLRHYSHRMEEEASSSSAAAVGGNLLKNEGSVDSLQLVATPETANLTIQQSGSGGLSPIAPALDGEGKERKLSSSSESPVVRGSPSSTGANRVLPKRRGTGGGGRGTVVARRNSTQPKSGGGKTSSTSQNTSPIPNHSPSDLSGAMKKPEPFDVEGHIRKQWRAGTPPPGILTELHSRHSIDLRPKSAPKAKDSAGKDSSTGRLGGGHRRSRFAGSTMGSQNLGRPDTQISGSSTNETPPNSAQSQRPRKSIAVASKRDPSSNVTPSEKGLDASKATAAAGGEPTSTTPVLSPEEQAIQDELSQQRAHRQELLDMRENLNKQLQDKNVTQKTFQIDGKTGKVISVHSAEGSARKPEATRFTVPQAYESAPTVAPPPAQTPTPRTGAGGARGGGPPRLNTAPAGSSRPKEGEFFTPDSGGVAMVLDVPLAGGVGIQESDGTQRKTDYSQPKNRVSKSEYKKIVAQHNIVSQIPQEQQVQQQQDTHKVGDAVPSTSSAPPIDPTKPTAAALAKLPAPPATARGLPSKKSTNQVGSEKSLPASARGRPRTQQSAGGGARTPGGKLQGAPAGYPISSYPKGAQAPKVTPRSHISTPRSPRRMTHNELVKAVEEVKSTVETSSPPRQGMRRNQKAEEDGLIEDLLSEVGSDAEEHQNQIEFY